MPAFRARARPCAAARFEMTTAIVASSCRETIASMIDCRLDPRPEIRTARRRLEGLEGGREPFWCGIGFAYRVVGLTVMPRRRRLATAGVLYHVLNRATKRSTIFRNPGDYAAFERLLVEAKSRVPLRLFVYCVMPNHWHLIVCPDSDGDLSKFMHWLTMTHAQRWHAHMGSTGTGSVYQGRFKAIPIQSDEHFLIVCRYVERNPLRGNLVPTARDWRWSSLWRRMHHCDVPLLDEWPVTRPREWLDWIDQPQSESEVAAIRSAITRGAPLGSEAWMVETARQLSLESSLRPQHRPTKRAPDPLLTDM